MHAFILFCSVSIILPYVVPTPFSSPFFYLFASSTYYYTVLKTLMFSANENIALRQHKRRVIEYVEECIPEDLLDLGATAMAMQVSCNAPGKYVRH
jgi:hypothetical protein